MATTHDFSTELYINSANDKRYLKNTLSNWTTVFPIQVALDPNIDYSISVMSASVSNTFPQFHEQENTFKMNDKIFVVDNTIIHTNTTALCVYLTNICAAQSLAVSFTMDSQTQRIKITNTTASDVVIDLSKQYLQFWEKIGFNYDVQRSLTGLTLTPADDVLLEYICKLISTETVYITCNQIKGNSYYPTDSNLPILCSIHITGGYGVYSVNERPFFYEHDLLYRSSFDSISFSVLDSKFRPLEMRGGGVNLSLIVKKVNLND